MNAGSYGTRTPSWPYHWFSRGSVISWYGPGVISSCRSDGGGVARMSTWANAGVASAIRTTARTSAFMPSLYPGDRTTQTHDLADVRHAVEGEDGALELLPARRGQEPAHVVAELLDDGGLRQ